MRSPSWPTSSRAYGSWKRASARSLSRARWTPTRSAVSETLRSAGSLTRTPPASVACGQQLEELERLAAEVGLGERMVPRRVADAGVEEDARPPLRLGVAEPQLAQVAGHLGVDLAVGPLQRLSGATVVARPVAHLAVEHAHGPAEEHAQPVLHPDGGVLVG